MTMNKVIRFYTQLSIGCLVIAVFCGVIAGLAIIL